MPLHYSQLRGAERDRGVNRTRRAVADLLKLRARSEFTAVDVVFDGREVRPHVTDAAFTMARQQRQRIGASVASFDWLAGLTAAMPAALAHEQGRIAAGEPLPMRDGDGTRKADEAALVDLPRGDATLVAPLVLGADHG
jgi:hypothetical protein